MRGEIQWRMDGASVGICGQFNHVTAVTHRAINKPGKVFAARLACMIKTLTRPCLRRKGRKLQRLGWHASGAGATDTAQHTGLPGAPAAPRISVQVYRGK